MHTLDNLLQNLVSNNVCNDPNLLPEKDRRILKSLNNQLDANKFLTENQGKLLIKILSENKTEVKKYYELIDTALEFPKWSRPFRVIDQVRKIYLSHQSIDKFFIEFSYNKKISSILNEIISTCRIPKSTTLNKVTPIPLTENNLYYIIKGLRSFRFEIDETLLNYYKEIERILSKKESFIIKFDNNDKISNALTNDIGADNLKNTLLIADRKVRYGYYYTIDNCTSLSEKIANRGKPRVWINNQTESLDSILNAIKELKRFPILFILDSHKPEDCYKNLTVIHCELNKLNKNVNVYFRLNSLTGKDFNQYITSHSLNKLTDRTTDAVVLDNSSLPKFLLKNDWYPQTVISFIPTFRNNKTSAYCDFVDLVVYYTDVKPLISDTDDIV